jgi:hypothetical protein
MHHRVVVMRRMRTSVKVQYLEAEMNKKKRRTFVHGEGGGRRGERGWQTKKLDSVTFTPQWIRQPKPRDDYSLSSGK